MKHLMKNHSNHYFVMFVIMILAGLLSTMNIWVDKMDDIRFSINDIYMILLMAGWMILFMSVYYQDLYPFIFGISLVVIIFWCIRTQFLVSPNQYISGMIPHHSMAILTSKKLIENHFSQNVNSNVVNVVNFVKNIIKTQEKEIEYMKKL
jgi:hypothetical protein